MTDTIDTIAIVLTCLVAVVGIAVPQIVLSWMDRHAIAKAQADLDRDQAETDRYNREVYPRLVEEWEAGGKRSPRPCPMPGPGRLVLYP